MKFGAKQLFKKWLDVDSRPIASEFGKKLIDGGIKHAPEHDVANYVVEETRQKAKKNRCK